MPTLVEQHPRLAERLSEVVRGWDDLYDGGETWISEVLFGFADRGEYEVRALESATGCPVVLSDDLVDVFLTPADVAERMGNRRRSLARYRLPTPDALTAGGGRLWRVSTIEAWDSRRPRRD